MNIPSLEDLSLLADKSRKDNKRFLTKLGKKKPKDLDSVTSKLHDDVFKDYDCLDCANCCKSISPIVTEQDVKRISKSLKMKVRSFVDEYLFVDHDEDYVFKQTPCPFLQDDNKCFVYDDRPKACREYPHTDRKRFHQILDVTAKNCHICPPVFGIVEELKTKY